MAEHAEPNGRVVRWVTIAIPLLLTVAGAVWAGGGLWSRVREVELKATRLETRLQKQNECISVKLERLLVGQTELRVQIHQLTARSAKERDGQ